MKLVIQDYSEIPIKETITNYVVGYRLYPGDGGKVITYAGYHAQYGEPTDPANGTEPVGPALVIHLITYVGFTD